MERLVLVAFWALALAPTPTPTPMPMIAAQISAHYRPRRLSGLTFLRAAEAYRVERARAYVQFCVIVRAIGSAKGPIGARLIKNHKRLQVQWGEKWQRQRCAPLKSALRLVWFRAARERRKRKQMPCGCCDKCARARVERYKGEAQCGLR